MGGAVLVTAPQHGPAAKLPPALSAIAAANLRVLRRKGRAG